MVLLAAVALALGTAAGAAPSGGETVELRGGAELAAAVRSFDGKSLTLEDGRVLPREAVLEVRFARAAAPAAAAPSPELAARGRELFAQAAEMARRFPGSDGLVLLDEGAYRLRPDGTWVERYRFAGRVLSDQVKGSWAETGLSFEEGRERARIVEATVYHTDGAAFPLDAAKVKTTEPQAGALFFQETRQLSYALPQVEVGSIVEWTLEKQTYNPFRKDFFFPRWGFRNAQPTRLSRLTIVVPSGRKLYWSARHFESGGSPRVTRGAGETSYEWTRRDVPAIPREPQAVPYYDYAPVVKAGLLKDWGPIYDWLEPMYRERSRPSPELAAAARRLVEGAKTDDDRIARLYHYVQKEVRYVAVKMGVASGWGGYDANLTWKRRYGCCIDKALLLTAMLRAVGLEAEPVLLDTNESARHDFSVPDIWFEHAITRVRADGRDFLLDATGEDYRYPSYAEMDHGVSVLDPAARAIVAFPVPRPEDNSEAADYELSLSSTGDAEATASFSYRGAREAGVRSWFKGQKKSDQERMFQDWVSEISPAGRLRGFSVVDAEDLSQPASFSMSYVLPDYPIRAADLSILKLPDWERDFEEVALDKRELALRYSSSEQIARRYEIRLPAGLRAASLPATRRLRGPHESYEQSCRAEGRVLRCRSLRRREARVFEPKDYAAHKRFLEQVSRLTKDHIFLEGTPR